MQVSNVVNELLELHTLIFEHGMSHGRGSRKVNIFSLQAPGHLGMDTIEVPNLNLDFKLLPEEIQNRITQIFSSGKASQKFPLHSVGLNSGCIECFLLSIVQTHLFAAISNPLNHYAAFLKEAVHNSQCIAQWIETGTTSSFLQTTIQPNIVMGAYKSLGSWIPQSLSMSEASLEGLSGWQSGQESLERLSSSSFFKREMQSLPTSQEEILAEVDTLSLSLWLALGEIYRIQDVKIERRPWKFSPDENSLLGIRFQIHWENTRENLSLQTFAKVRLRHGSFFAQADKLPEELYARILRWMKILSANPKAVYALNIISDGFRDVARSVGEQSFRKDRIARDGIFKVISGLEGIISQCKTITKNGHRIDAYQTFVECWGVIWKKILLVDSQNSSLSKAKNIDAALGSIYHLRSDLAHADPSSLSESLTKVQQLCGGLFNSPKNDSCSVGMSILIITGELLEFFFANETVLSDLIAGKKPIS